MRDQANELRNLVARASLEQKSIAGSAPRLIALTGGKGGVGTSTLSLNLSLALSQQGRRVVLVDADLRRADVSLMCGLDGKYSIADVLTARRNIHEVLQPGPGGILVLPGAWAPKSVIDTTPLSHQRLTKQLRGLGRHADIVLLDVGNESNETVRQYWDSSDHVLMVTTGDFASIMDSYATIKLFSRDSQPTSISVIVNQIEDKEVAKEIYRRIDNSCRRFLGYSITSAGHIPFDPQISHNIHSNTPTDIQSPQSKAAKSINHIAALIGSNQAIENAA